MLILNEWRKIMNIRCFFGRHDWQEVKSVTEEFAIDNLLENRFRNHATARRIVREQYLKGFIPADCTRKELRQYVCLRKDCCAVKDEIKEFLDRCNYDWHELMKKEQQRTERQKQANTMLESCAKDKLMSAPPREVG
jgi:hypothetical protein